MYSKGRNNLRAFSTDAAGKLNVLRHDGHTLGVNGAKVSVFEQANKVSFGSFLQSQDGRALEAKVGLEALEAKVGRERACEPC